MDTIIPKMPEEYKGVETKKTSYTKNTPRKWTSEEVEWCLKLKERGFTNKEIATSIGREEVSTSIKLKRVTKKDDTYNKKHLEDKYATNKEYYEFIKPKSLLDVYCGVKKYWSSNYNIKVTTNDVDKNIDSDYNLDSLKLLCKMYYEGNKFDVVDLDPFGSAYDCFDLAIKMAKRGIVITLGEMGHKRFKRFDFVDRYYGINNMDDFTSDNIIEEIKKIGLKNKKLLKVFSKKDWQGISRVWFYIEQFKVIEK